MELMILFLIVELVLKFILVIVVVLSCGVRCVRMYKVYRK